MDDLLAALGATKQSVAKLVEDVKSGIALHLTSTSPSLPGALMKILKEARRRGAALGAVTCLPKNTADPLMASLGLQDMGVNLLSLEPDPEEQFPGPDSWLKLAKSCSRKDWAHCTVLAASMSACRTALSAGMSCVAIPDSFTSFQDFSGADWIVEDLDDADVPAIVDFLVPKE
jgi:beta-phosphoglucomutase-like phosphatase (HAD superfamily)